MARAKDFMFEDEARKYFSDLAKTSSSGKIKTLLQQYWLCALIGLIFNEQKTPVDARPVVDWFVKPLDRHEHEIRALAFWRYATEKKYSPRPEDSEKILRALRDFFDEDARSRLGEVGVDHLDGHAAGGFRILRKRIPKPNDLATFLVDYIQLLGEAEVPAVSSPATS